MGLLDKANDAGKAPTETPKKAVAKAIPQTVAPAQMAKPVKAAKAAKVPKASRVKRPKLNTDGLPEGYEIATKNSRFLAWLMNFIWNFGVLFGALFLSVMGSTPTIPAVGALLMIVTNVFVIPIMTGRTLGNFMSRTRYITSADAKPNPVHGFLVNSVGLMALVGFSLVIFNMGNLFDDSGKPAPINIAFLILGIILFSIRIVDGRFKKNSDQNQGLYDMIFGAYLVKYVPSPDEELTGIAARLEGMANFGDSFTKRREESMKKKVNKVKKVKNADTKATEKDSEKNSEKDSNDADESADSKEESSE
jgi:hypothetical protein